MKPLDPRVVPLLTPARAALAGVIGSGIVAAGLVAGQAFAVAALVAELLAAPSGDGWHGPAWWLLGISLARALVGAYADLAAARAAGQVTNALRAQVLRAAMDLGATGLAGRRSGELGLLATRGVAAVEPYLTRFVPTLVLAAVLPPLTVALILAQDLWAAVIVLATLPLVPIFAVLIGLATRDRADRQYRTLSRLAGHFVDVVRGLPTLVTYNRAGAQSGRIRTITDHYRRTTLDTLRLAFASSGALELIATLSVALVAVSVGLRLADGGLDLRTALVVLLLAPEAYWPLRRVGAEFHAAAEGVATLNAVTDLLEEARATRPEAVCGSRTSDQVDPVPLHLRDVVVTYPGCAGPALVLPEATIPAAGLTAVVGPSGCGKSTLVQALLGELPTTSGTITLAGEPIDLAQWRPLVAQVPQTPWLTAGTVADNLRIGRPDAEEPRLWDALAAVDLQDAVAALPRGLDTALGEDGAGLSAGQRARLALARVVLANRPYVVLDEPSAHLDPATEQVLLRTLRRLARHATVVVVAHRQAVVDAADHVITLAAPEAEDRQDSAASALPGHPESVPGGARAAATANGPGENPVHARRRLALATLLATGASLSGVALTATAGWLIAKAALHPPVLLLMVAIVGVRTFGLARPALRYAERLVSHDVALRMLAETRARVYDVLVPLAPARLGRRRGDLLAAVVDDVDAQLDDQLRVRQPALAAAGTGVVATAVAGLVHAPAALPVGALALVVGALALGLAWWGAREAESAFVAERATLSTEVVTDLQSARQLVLWQVDDAAIQRLRAIGGRLTAATRRTTRAAASARALLVVAAGAAVVVTAWLTAPGLVAGGVSGPMTALLVLLPLALHDVLATLPDAGATAVRTSAARRRLAGLEEIVPAVTEPDEPVRVDGPVDLRLDRVSSGWTARPVLHDLDLDLPAGGALGVVGPSGSGKSTLAATLVRHVSPTSGSCTVAGTDAERLGSAEVRRHVSLVDDDPYVFASTLRENLRLAAPTSDDDVLLDALRAADLLPWYAGLSDGLDTLLGDGAASVSGGERARIGLARAHLAAPDVLVLDEPTAHLDAGTAEAVTRTLLAARTGRTLVWITHTDTGLAAMDRVLTLVDGRAARPGSGALEHPLADG